MVRQNTSRRRARKTRDSSAAIAATAEPRRVSTFAHVAGILLLAVCVATSLALVLEHVGGLSLPGCGEGSPCAEAAASVWGRVPYVDWPVSFLGLAYFLGLLVTWLSIRPGIPRGVRHVVRGGVLVSLGFAVIMVVERHVCSYCLATHAANVLFWIVLERTVPRTTHRMRGLAVLAAVFLTTSAVLGVVEWRTRQVVQAEAEEELTKSMERIASPASQPIAAPGEIAEPVVPAPVAKEAVATSRPESEDSGFTGRYRLGPERAAVRVVVISDYQCKECRRIEGDVMRLYEARDDMSVSAKHYPMNSDCNRNSKTRAHKNACWATRAAEAAGILRGNDGFWEMHGWLFERGGGFTREELRAGLREFGYAIPEFERVMQSDEALALVQADVEEASGLGVWYTPTIYINGVELRGWSAPNAVARAVERLAATNPPALTATHDRPAPALEKLIGDWLAEPRKRIPAGAVFQSTGPEEAVARVVLFGDYQQSGTAEVDAVVRREVTDRGDVRYEYRHFPFNKDCNPAVKRETKYWQSCRAAQAAHAAGEMGGAQGYWQMHAWLLANQDDLSEAALREAAATIGLDPDAFLAETERPATHSAVVEDAKIGQRLRVTSVPTVFVNGRKVPRWTMGGENILPQIIAETAGE